MRKRCPRKDRMNARSLSLCVHVCAHTRIGNLALSFVCIHSRTACEQAGGRVSWALPGQRDAWQSQPRC